MEQFPMDETIDLDEQRFIFLSFDRVWPKYVVTWSIRQRSGDGDFPIASGTTESLLTDGESMDEMWDRLRREAQEVAQSAAPHASSEPAKKTGLMTRLFGRNSGD